MVARYREIPREKPRLFAAPLVPGMLDKLVWPLRHAKAGYVTGNLPRLARLVRLRRRDAGHPALRAVHRPGWAQADRRSRAEGPVRPAVRGAGAGETDRGARDAGPDRR